MATTGVMTGALNTKTVIIDSNLADKEYYLVTLDTTDEGVVNLAAAATAQTFVLLEAYDGSTTSRVGTIALPGSLTKVKCGASVTAGNFIMSDAAGKAIPVTTGKYFSGVAMENGATDDIIQIVTVNGIAP